MLKDDIQEYMIKGIRCTKKAFSLFEARGKEASVCVCQYVNVHGN